MLVYAGRRWIGSGAGVPGLVRERSFLYNTAFCERTVLAVLCFLYAAYYGMDFLTRRRHRYMYTSMGCPHGTGGILFPLSLRLLELIRTVGVEDTLRWTELQAQHAEKLLNHIGGIAWHRGPGSA